MGDTEYWSKLISNINKRFDVDFETGVIVSKRTGKPIVLVGVMVNIGYA